MKESIVQTQIKKALEASGWWVTKLLQTSTNGIPDIMALKDGRAIFIEVKKPGGKVSDLQKYRIDQLKKLGFTAFVSDSVDAIHEFIAEKILPQSGVN